MSDQHKLSGREASLRNLRPFKRGEVGNRTGKNGVDWLWNFRRYFDEEGGNGNTRFYNVMQKLYANAISGEPTAIRVIVEYMNGKPKQPPTQLDYAEHFRQIQADRAKLAIALLGDRIKTMTSDEIAAHLSACSQDATAFLEIAKRYLTEDGTRPLIDSPQSTPGALEAAEQPDEGGEQVQDVASDSDE